MQLYNKNMDHSYKKLDHLHNKKSNQLYIWINQLTVSQ